MKQLKTVIIDDEEPARQRLKRLLKKHADIISIDGEADNGISGAELIDKTHPDLVFLDIQMPGLSGFEMLKKLDHKPIIIFTTAYEEYALSAFEENSIDYLLKPIEEDRLEKCIDKLENFNSDNSNTNDLEKISELLGQLKSGEESKMKSIPVKKGDKTILLKLDDVLYLEAKEKYVFLNTTDEREHLIDLSLTYLEAKLPDNFMRVHRSHIVNTNFIKEIQKYFDGKYVLLLNNKAGTKITTGASYGKSIKNLIEV